MVFSLLEGYIRLEYACLEFWGEQKDGRALRSVVEVRNCNEKLLTLHVAKMGCWLIARSTCSLGTRSARFLGITNF